MSNAITQNATNLAVSNSGEWDADMFLTVARRASVQTLSGLTREHKQLNWNKLISAVCATYRDHFPEIYAKTDRIPSEVFEKAQDAVHTVIAESMGAVNPQNIVSVKRQAVHKYADRKFVEKVIMTGENAMSLAEQKLFSSIAIREAKEKLARLLKKPNPDHDAENKQTRVIEKLEDTHRHILATIEASAK